MANHDFGSPCDCLDCRTRPRPEVCIHCGFENLLEVVGTANLSVDRKGIRGYDVTYPSEPDMDLTCRKCHRTSRVPYYTSVNENACARGLERDRIAASAHPCDRCGECVEFQGDHYVQIALTTFGNQRLCGRCLPLVAMASTPDPSDDSNKFRFDRQALRWERWKIRVPCEGCGRVRWILAKNAWRRLCERCYSAGRGG